MVRLLLETMAPPPKAGGFPPFAKVPWKNKPIFPVIGSFKNQIHIKPSLKEMEGVQSFSQLPTTPLPLPSPSPPPPLPLRSPPPPLPSSSPSPPPLLPLSSPSPPPAGTFRKIPRAFKSISPGIRDGHPGVRHHRRGSGLPLEAVGAPRSSFLFLPLNHRHSDLDFYHSIGNHFLMAANVDTYPIPFESCKLVNIQ